MLPALFYAPVPAVAVTCSHHSCSTRANCAGLWI